MKARHAIKKAEYLREQQILIQKQRSQMLQDPMSTGTPVIKDGKVVGYAVQVDPNAAPLPRVSLPMSPENMSLGITDNDFPELDDYSILEPEITLTESPIPIKIPNLIRAPVPAPAPRPMPQIVPRTGPVGARQVVVNGKLLTLVPYGSAQAAQNAPRVIRAPYMTPGGQPLGARQMGARQMGPYKMMGPRGPVGPMITRHTTPIVPRGGRLPLPAHLDEVQCDLCTVKLPRNILPMHKKIRHSDVMKARTMKAAQDSSNDEIQIVDSPKSRRPMPGLLELQPETILTEGDETIEPPDTIGDGENQDPLADPLAI